MEKFGVSPQEFFRVGPGYVEYWIHELTHHNILDSRQRHAVLGLGQSLRQLMDQRNAIESARRAFIPVSRLDTLRKPTKSREERLFDSTKSYYLSFYSSLSSMAALVKRFQKTFGNAPHSSNTRFLEWLEPRAFFPEKWKTLRSALAFRTLLDHPASKQPYTWAAELSEHSVLRSALYGQASLDGAFPTGAEPAESSDGSATGRNWVFRSPDEDEVLSLLAVQLNVLAFAIQKDHFEPASLPCSWEPPLSDEDPEAGYPVFATESGQVFAVGPMTPQVSEEDQAKIDAILQPYVDRMREVPNQ